MNLCRVLPNGADAKAAVDAAIDACAAIGNLRADIHACKQAAEGGQSFGGEEEGARRRRCVLAGWLAGWMDGWVDGWMDGWMGGLHARGGAAAAAGGGELADK